MFNNLLLKFALLLVVSFAANAQPVSDSDLTQLQNYLYGELTKQNFVKHNRITTEGELSSCEAEFQYVYRDIRARKGAPIVLTGSFSSIWSNGKVPSFMFKVNAAELEMKTSKWSITAPSFINITIKNQSFKPFKFVDFVCESGGRCTGYTDPKLGINMALIQTNPFDATLTWALENGGMDTSVKMSNIGNKQVTREALQSFYSCNVEMNQKLVDYFKTDKSK